MQDDGLTRYALLRLELFNKTVNLVTYVISTVATLALLELAIKYFPASLFIKLLGVHGAQILIVCSVLVLGFGAALFKKIAQFYYGWCELVFATASAIWIVKDSLGATVVLSQWTALIGSAYIVARGMGNMAEAKIKQQSAQESLRRCLI